jgi:hypothetical protein
MNLFLGGVENLFRGDHSLLKEPFQDLEGAALQVLFRLFVKVTMFTDEIDE